MKRRRVLVTGAAGFIGSSLATRLAQEDRYDVIGVDSFTDYYSYRLKAANVSGLDGRVNFVEGDLLSIDLDELLDDVAFIFHQAGQPGVRKSWGNSFAVYTELNVMLTQRLLEASVRASSLQKFVYASSSSVYGNAGSFPTRESTLPQPVSPYGVTKLAAEHLCCLYAANYGVPTISLRYFTVYGPKQRPDMAFTRFCCAARDGLPITIFGDGSQIRDFTYIDDIVEANIRAAGSQTAPGEVVNVSGGGSISLRDAVGYISEISGSTLSVNYTKMAQGDVFRTGGDTCRAQALLDWSPKVDLYDGLKRQYSWVLQPRLEFPNASAALV